MRLFLLACIFGVVAESYGQEKGTAAAYRAERASRAVIQGADQQRQDADDARVFAGVKDLESLRKVLPSYRNQLSSTLYDRREKTRTEKSKPTERTKKIATINKLIERINDPSQPYLPDLTSTHIITLSDPVYRKIRIEQVVDKNNAIATSIEAVDGRRNRQFWMAGVDTLGWADGQTVELTGVLINAGSKQYTTAIGATRTLPLMKRVDLTADENSEFNGVREWKTKSGKTVVGALVLYDAGKCTIKSMDGKQTILKLVDLSDDDWDYASDHTPAPKRRGAQPL